MVCLINQESRFRDIKDKLSAFLNKQAGFRDKDLTFIPCSGLTGNMISLSLSPYITSFTTCPLSQFYISAFLDKQAGFRDKDLPFPAVTLPVRYISFLFYLFVSPSLSQEEQVCLSGLIQPFIFLSKISTTTKFLSCFIFTEKKLFFNVR